MDQNKVEKVLNNLISNAIKHSNTDSEIHVGLSRMESLYTVEVTDSGKGVSEDERTRIFDRFHQSKDGKLHGGTGIGLSLSRELARLMGGDIIVEDGESKGAKFFFTFEA